MRAGDGRSWCCWQPSQSFRAVEGLRSVRCQIFTGTRDSTRAMHTSDQHGRRLR